MVVPGSQQQDTETCDDAHWTKAKAAVLSILYVNYLFLNLPSSIETKVLKA